MYPFMIPRVIVPVYYKVCNCILYKVRYSAPTDVLGKKTALVRVSIDFLQLYVSMQVTELIVA